MRRLLTLLLLLAGCASQPIPAPQTADSAVLVVRANVYDYYGRGVTRTPHKAYFARLPDEGEAVIDAVDVVETAHHRGPLAFAFNVPPGRYVVVCLVTVWEGKDRFVFLPEAAVSASVTEVKAGDRAYMGAVTVRETRNWSRADPVQKRFLRLVQAGPVKPNTLQKLFPRAIEYCGEDGRLSRTAADEKYTRKTLDSVLPGMGWE